MEAAHFHHVQVDHQLLGWSFCRMRSCNRTGPFYVTTCKDSAVLEDAVFHVLPRGSSGSRNIHKKRQLSVIKLCAVPARKLILAPAVSIEEEDLVDDGQHQGGVAHLGLEHALWEGH